MLFAVSRRGRESCEREGEERVVCVRARRETCLFPSRSPTTTHTHLPISPPRVQRFAQLKLFGFGGDSGRVRVCARAQSGRDAGQVLRRHVSRQVHSQLGCSSVQLVRTLADAAGERLGGGGQAARERRVPQRGRQGARQPGGVQVDGGVIVS